MQKLIDEINDHYRRQGKRPVFQLGRNCKFIIISQAPGKKVHDTGIPWNDRSGDTLRSWLGVIKEEFYDKDLFSIMPMDFCYPGTGTSGDLPPDADCAPLWHPRILRKMKNNPVKLLLGTYAIDYYLKDRKAMTLAETVKAFRNFLPEFFPLPHPSPRNINWIKKNPWFATDVLPALKQLIRENKNHRI